MTLDELVARDKGICQLCGGKVDPRKKALAPTRDHKIPVSRGGPGTDDNIQLAHWRCNQLKSDR